MLNEYEISDDELNKILHHAGILFNIGMHMTYKYKEEHDSDMDMELLCDGCDYKLNKSYQFIYNLVNTICTDKKLDGELE